jgi:hypothetical protein
MLYTFPSEQACRNLFLMPFCYIPDFITSTQITVEPFFEKRTPFRKSSLRYAGRNPTRGVFHCGTREEILRLGFFANSVGKKSEASDVMDFLDSPPCIVVAVITLVNNITTQG